MLKPQFAFHIERLKYDMHHTVQTFGLVGFRTI